MAQASAMIPCPSCGAALQAGGLCAYCGNQARGFWQNLDLGTPELAAAVMQGLDYYLVLGVLPEMNAAQIAGSYRRARQRFPDDLRRLDPRLAKEVGLIEEAWRILGTPVRRAEYDRLRGHKQMQAPEMRAVTCGQCGAGLAQNAKFCPACGAERPDYAAVAMPREKARYVRDYYEVLGVTSEPQRKLHVAQAQNTQLGVFGSQAVDDQLRMAYLNRLQQTMYANDPEAELEIEVAWQVLSDPERRTAYDHLRNQLGRGEAWVLEALTALDSEARAELSGTVLHQVDGTTLLKQGRGFMGLHQYHQAVPPLAQAIKLLPASAEAHYWYAMALWKLGKPSDLPAHQLHALEESLSKAIALDGRVASVLEPYLLTVRGVIKNNAGAQAAAAALFETVVTRYPTFGMAWYMRAAVLLRQGKHALALDACRQALQLEPSNEAVLFLAIAACWRQKEVAQARDLADRVAALRGGHTTGEDVLRELGLR